MVIRTTLYERNKSFRLVGAAPADAGIPPNDPDYDDNDDAIAKAKTLVQSQRTNKRQW